jgi:hypothetical protein
VPDPVCEKACVHIIPKGKEDTKGSESVDEFLLVSDGQKIDKKALALGIAQKLKLERTKE